MEDDSYTVQHFGMSPKNVADYMYNIWFDYTERCLDALKISIRDKALASIPPDVLESTVGAVFHAMIPGMNREASKLEELLRQDIMRIPPHVLLPGDEVHRNPPEDQALGVASLKLQLESVRKRLAEEAARQRELEGELGHQECVRKVLQATLASARVLEEATATTEAAATTVPGASSGTWDNHS